MPVQGETKERIRSQVREPKRYRVIMHNDDYTTMDFVVRVLMEVFHKGEEAAVALMMEVHKSGKAAVGTYSYDVALTKIRAAMGQAEKEGYPFRLTLEEA